MGYSGVYSGFSEENKAKKKAAAKEAVAVAFKVKWDEDLILSWINRRKNCFQFHSHCHCHTLLSIVECMSLSVSEEIKTKLSSSFADYSLFHAVMACAIIYALCIENREISDLINVGHNKWMDNVMKEGMEKSSLC